MSGSESIDFILDNLRNDDSDDTSKALLILEAISDDKLELILHELSLTSKIVPFLRCILYACDISRQSEQVLRRRKLCFEISIVVLKGGSLNQQDARELVEMLIHHCRQLYSEQILSLIDAILDNSPIGGTNSFIQLLELLPVLVGDSVDCREYAIEKLYDMTWPRDLVLGYAATLVDMCATETECERAMTKIMSFLVIQRGAIYNGPTISPDPEELPVLVYHLTSISKKCTTSSLLKKSLLEVISESLDAMLASSVAAGTATTGLGADQFFSLRRMRPILSNITHHVSMMLTKDQVTV